MNNTEKAKAETEKKKKFSEWDWYKNKFGKAAYILFPLFHLIALAILIVAINLIIRSCSR